MYVTNSTMGEVYSLNAFSNVVYRTFEIGAAPARPYTTPEGVFLYMTDARSGRFVSVEQSRFEVHSDLNVGTGINLVTVGRFDRMNLLASTSGKNFVFYDNLRRARSRRSRDSGRALHPGRQHGRARVQRRTLEQRLPLIAGAARPS